MLTIKELAERLKISLSLAYRLVASGEIPCYQIASCKRVSEEDLLEFLERARKSRVRHPSARRTHF